MKQRAQTVLTGQAIGVLHASPPLSQTPRYAIYFTTPAEHALTAAAQEWFGRGAHEGETRNSMSAERAALHDAIVSEPRKYGFHATLKAPFRLACGVSVEELEAAISAFCAYTRPCPIGPLRVAMLGGFFALMPEQAIPGIPALASRIVEFFDRFRAPFDADEFRRRMIDQLDEKETEYLVRWGYPYVFEQFRFHMTLTNRIAPENRAVIEAELHRRFGRLLGEDYSIDALALFEQPDPGSEFVLRRRFDLNRNTQL